MAEGAALAASVASAVASTASVATGIAGTVKQKQALDAQTAAQKKQAEQEKKARDAARKAALSRVEGGVSGNILASSGLGGSTATSAGKSTLLGGA